MNTMTIKQDSATASKIKGSIVVVGPGIMLGAHITPRSRTYIEKADLVFYCCPMLVRDWITTLNPNTRNLGEYYGIEKDRRITYREMVDAMLAAVRDGLKVVAVFYGHPGVFAWSTHKVIEEARAEGYTAHMEPGISADACLYADMGIDPARYGCQSYETSQFMFYQRKIDPTAYLLLWQPAHAGDTQIKNQPSTPAQRQVLVDLLCETYPAEHQVALYKAPFLPMDKPSIRWFALQDFASIDIDLVETLVIPPAQKMQFNQSIMNKLHALNQ